MYFRHQATEIRAVKVYVVFDIQCAIATSQHTDRKTHSLSGSVSNWHKVADWVR